MGGDAARMMQILSTPEGLTELRHITCRGTHEQRLARYTARTCSSSTTLASSPCAGPAPRICTRRHQRTLREGLDRLTSNRDRAEWPDLFGEALLASAALDRLTRGAHFVEITGASFRAEHTQEADRDLAEPGQSLIRVVNP
jgi:hypothetical protein